ncbi:MAG: hypothetical protein WCJ51_01585 [Candidatus Moraniibacteriota bacterium]
MQEDNKQEDLIVPVAISKPAYYDNKHSKTVDFFAGFASAMIFLVFSFILSLSIANSYILPTIISGVAVTILVGFSILLFRRGRKFFAIGMAVAYLIPLLLFGSCLPALFQY